MPAGQEHKKKRSKIRLDNIPEDSVSNVSIVRFKEQMFSWDRKGSNRPL